MLVGECPTQTRAEGEKFTAIFLALNQAISMYDPVLYTIYETFEFDRKERSPPMRKRITSKDKREYDR